METRASFPTAVSPAVSGSFVDETGHLIDVSNKWASLPIYSASIRGGTYEFMKGKARVRNLMVATEVTRRPWLRRPEYQATQKSWASIAKTKPWLRGSPPDVPPRQPAKYRTRRPASIGAAFYLALYPCYLGPKCVFSVCLRRCSPSPRPLATVANSSNAASGSAAW